MWVGGLQRGSPPTMSAILAARTTIRRRTADVGRSTSAANIAAGVGTVVWGSRLAVASGCCTGSDNRACRKIRGDVSRLGARRHRVVGNVSSGFSRRQLVQAQVPSRQRTRLKRGPAVVRALGPVLRREARRGRAGDGRAIRRRTSGPRGAHRLGARCVRTLPHCHGHPVKVPTVDEHPRAPTSVEAHRPSVCVEGDGHQRHPDHLLCVEVVTHLRKPEGPRVPGVDEPVVDELHREIVDSDADGLLHVRGDVLAYLVPNLCPSCLVVEVRAVEDLNRERIHPRHLAVDDLVHRSELENVIPREPRLGRTCVDAVDVPLLGAHTLHQSGPREGLSGVAKRTVQQIRLNQRRRSRVAGGVDDGGVFTLRNKREVADGTVAVLDANRFSSGRDVRTGRCDASLQGIAGSRHGLLVLGVDTPGLEGCVAATRVSARHQVVERGQGHVRGTIASPVAAQGGNRGRVGHVDRGGSGAGRAVRRRRGRGGGIGGAPSEGGHEHQGAGQQAELSGALHERTSFPSGWPSAGWR